MCGSVVRPIACLAVAVFCSLPIQTRAQDNKIDTGGIFTIYRLGPDSESFVFAGTGFYVGNNIAVTAAHVFYPGGTSQLSSLKDAFRVVLGANINKSNQISPTGLYKCATGSLDLSERRDICFFQLDGIIPKETNSYNLSCPNLVDGAELRIAGYYLSQGNVQTLVPTATTVQAAINGTRRVDQLGIEITNGYLQTQFEPQGGLSGAPVFDSAGRVVGVHAGEVDTQFFSPISGMNSLSLAQTGVRVFDNQQCLSNGAGVGIQGNAGADLAEEAAFEPVEIKKFVKFLDQWGNPIYGPAFLGQSATAKLVLETTETGSSATPIFTSISLDTGLAFNDVPTNSSFVLTEDVQLQNTKARLAISFMSDAPKSTTYRESSTKDFSSWLSDQAARLEHPRRVMIIQRDRLDEEIDNLVRCMDNKCGEKSLDFRVAALLEVSSHFHHWVTTYIKEAAYGNDCCSESGASAMAMILKLAEAGNVLAQAKHHRDAQSQYKNTYRLLDQLDSHLEHERSAEIAPKIQKRIVKLISNLSANWTKLLAKSEGKEPFLLWIEGDAFHNLVTQSFSFFSSFSSENASAYKANLRYQFAVLVASQIGRNAETATGGKGFASALRYCNGEVICKRQLVELAKVPYSGNALPKYIRDGIVTDTCSAMRSLWEVLAIELEKDVCVEDASYTQAAQERAFQELYGTVTSGERFFRSTIGASADEDEVKEMDISDFEVVVGQDDEVSVEVNVANTARIIQLSDDVDSPGSIRSQIESIGKVWGGKQVYLP